MDKINTNGREIEKKILNELKDDICELKGAGKLHRIEDAMDSAMEKFKNALRETTAEVINIADNEDNSSKKKTHPTCGREIGLTSYDEKLDILTKYGVVTIRRNYFFCRYCHKGYIPMDEQLRLYGDHKVTYAMSDLISYAGQLAMSFEKSSEIMEKFMGVTVCESIIRSITEETGKMVFEKDITQAKETFEKPNLAVSKLLIKKEGVLYILTDGSHVNTKIRDKDGSSWHEMKLGLVFWDSDSIKRKDGKSVITQKEYVAYFGGVGEFKKLLFDAAIRAGYSMITEVVMIGDGAPWIWKLCKELFPNAVQILDYYHMIENVNNFSKYLFRNNEVKAKGWANEIIKKIENCEIEEVITALPDLKGKKLPLNVPNLKTYLENNKNRLNYLEYEEKGYYIGSGSIESGNKLVIQQRMKQSGMRWSIQGGQYVASLRAKYASNRWYEVRSIIGL